MKNHSFAFTLLCTAAIAASSHSIQVTHSSSHNAHARQVARSGGPKRCKTHSFSGSATTPKLAEKAVKASSSCSGANAAASLRPCGDVGATAEITSQSGPNGNIHWMNCGIDNGGWNPSYLDIEHVIVEDLTAALQARNTPFAICAPYVDKFYQYGNQFDIPPIIIASFAMQESSCNHALVGGAGEQGLMQLTADKCTDAPRGNCQDIDYNIMTGTKFFRSLLDSHGGNVLLSVGSYNGWFKGMTHEDATASASTCCRCQNNLDYLHQFLNGWCQNVDAYAENLGIYHNLDACPSG
ncbi:lysozyme-like domain-containing protein [Rhodocollybia butyracea]|uniref:Lysozyme-like domain-containing protein n=1 Tax=Rhodocollybia butyracea TaxID=206335 RepID=A0A9P5PQ68_9AGAR|nr:lysozyme-like domain-containing protein [Rhodocollybia butyracea]